MKKMYTLCTVLLVSSTLHGMNQGLKRGRSSSLAITKQEWKRENLKFQYYKKLEHEQLKSQYYDAYYQQAQLKNISNALVEIEAAHSRIENLIAESEQLISQSKKVEEEYKGLANAPWLGFKKHLSTTGQLCITIGAALCLSTSALILHNEYCIQSGLNNPLHYFLCGSFGAQESG